ncbi:hypothetical protein MC885_005277, partial [Smutsia gigantea]
GERQRASRVSDCRGFVCHLYSNSQASGLNDKKSKAYERTVVAGLLAGLCDDQLLISVVKLRFQDSKNEGGVVEALLGLSIFWGQDSLESLVLELKRKIPTLCFSPWESNERISIQGLFLAIKRLKESLVLQACCILGKKTGILSVQGKSGISGASEGVHREAVILWRHSDPQYLRLLAEEKCLFLTQKKSSLYESTLKKFHVVCQDRVDGETTTVWINSAQDGKESRDKRTIKLAGEQLSSRYLQVLINFCRTHIDITGSPSGTYLFKKEVVKLVRQKVWSKISFRSENYRFTIRRSVGSMHIKGYDWMESGYHKEQPRPVASDVALVEGSLTEVKHSGKPQEKLLFTEQVAVEDNEVELQSRSHVCSGRLMAMPALLLTQPPEERSQQGKELLLPCFGEGDCSASCVSKIFVFSAVMVAAELEVHLEDSEVSVFNRKFFRSYSDDVLGELALVASAQVVRISRATAPFADVHSRGRAMTAISRTAGAKEMATANCRRSGEGTFKDMLEDSRPLGTGGILGVRSGPQLDDVKCCSTSSKKKKGINVQPVLKGFSGNMPSERPPSYAKGIPKEQEEDREEKKEGWESLDQKQWMAAACLQGATALPPFRGQRTLLKTFVDKPSKRTLTEQPWLRQPDEVGETQGFGPRCCTERKLQIGDGPRVVLLRAVGRPNVHRQAWRGGQAQPHLDAAGALRRGPRAHALLG